MTASGLLPQLAWAGHGKVLIRGIQGDEALKSQQPIIREYLLNLETLTMIRETIQELDHRTCLQDHGLRWTQQT
jgi:hypothetical protein